MPPCELVSEKLYRMEGELAKPRGDRAIPRGLPVKPPAGRAEIANTPGSTSSWEASRFDRPAPGNRCAHPPGAGCACIPARRGRRAGANGSTPLPFPNCVHYVTKPVGEHLKDLVSAAGRVMACLAWSSAPRHLGARDRFIGWSAEARRRNIRFLAYNPRYLILPWVRVPHLASHVLGQMARRIAADWDRIYGHPVYFLETFVDPERYRGTCYRAANWVVMGRTTGRGKNCPNKRPNRSIKEVLGYPLTPHFRQWLAEV
jgi:hypothetical protein